MRTPRSIYWTDDTARLAGYSASAKGKATTIKIELAVSCPDRMGWIMSELASIKQKQGMVEVDAEVVPEFSTRHELPGVPQLRITDRRKG